MRITATALLALIVSVGLAGARPSDAPEYKKVVKHFDGDQTVMGETISYPEGKPVNIQSLIVTLRPGESTGWHKHGVPTYGYILSGTVDVTYRDRGKRSYSRGQAFMEAMDVWHNGSTVGDEPVRILVVFMGAKGGRPVIRDGAPK